MALAAALVMMICSSTLPAWAVSATIPAPIDKHGYTLLAPFSTSTITLATTIPNSGFSFTNAVDTWLVVSLDLRYKSSSGAVSTQTVEVPAVAFLNVSDELVSFRISTTTLAAHSAYTNVCNLCSPDSGVPGCKCDNVVFYRVVSANYTVSTEKIAEIGESSTHLQGALIAAKIRIEDGNVTVESNLVFSRSSNPSDIYASTSIFASVPVTTLNNTGDDKALYSCMGAGLVPALISTSKENAQVQQMSPTRSLLLDIAWNERMLRWQHGKKNLAWCLFWGACFGVFGSYHNLGRFNGGVTLPLVFDRVSGYWVSVRNTTYDAVLCADALSVPTTTEVTPSWVSSPPEATGTSSAAPPRTTLQSAARFPSAVTPMNTDGVPDFFPPAALMTTVASTSTTTTTPSTTTASTSTTEPTTTPQTSSPTETAPTSTPSPGQPQPTATTIKPTYSDATVTTPTTTPSGSNVPDNKYRLQLTLASQVYDTADARTALWMMLMKSISTSQPRPNQPTSHLSTTAPVVTILELVPGSTVVVAQADNVDETDMARLRADIETGASELVTVFGAIASSLRIDRIFPSHPGLAAAATALLLATMLACVVASVVGCVLYARESIRRTNERREVEMSRKTIYTTERNRASKAFSITAGQLFQDGRPIKCKLKAVEATDNSDQHDLVSGPLDGGRLTTNQQRVDSANTIWGNPMEEDFPVPRAARTIQWTEQEPTEI